MTQNNTVPEDFWGQIRHQLDRIRAGADTFTKVRQILLDPIYDQLATEREFPADAAFFAGSGGNDQLFDALEDAGWRFAHFRQWYWYSAQNKVTGDLLTYVEGDVFATDLLANNDQD